MHVSVDIRAPSYVHSGVSITLCHILLRQFLSLALRFVIFFQVDWLAIPTIFFVSPLAIVEVIVKSV